MPSQTSSSPRRSAQSEGGVGWGGGLVRVVLLTWPVCGRLFTYYTYGCSIVAYILLTYPQVLANTRVPASQISLYYYVGFCYVMMRRYKVA